MNDARPIWKFSLLVIGIWVFLVLASLAIHFWAPDSVKPWAYWVAGILAIAVGIADKVWKYLERPEAEPEPPGEAPPQITVGRDLGAGSAVGESSVTAGIIAGRDVFIGERPPEKKEGPVNTAPPPTTSEAEYVERELTQEIREALLRHERTGITGRAGLAGLGGVGKSEMAKTLARELEASFPGGVYWVAFGLAGEAPRPIEEVARDLLRQLGVEPDPQGDITYWAKQAQEALRRGEGARLLIYDDVREAHTPYLSDGLLPPGECALLVTTRLQTLPAKALPGGALHSLDVFSPKEAEEAMRGVLGNAVCDAEPEALAEVLRLCGYLALAVNVSARLIERETRLRGAEKPIARQAARLKDERGRLAALGLPEDELSVQAVLGTSYEDLNEEVQRRFDALGVFAGEDFPLITVTAVWWPDTFGKDEATIVARLDETQATLDELVRRSMLQPAGEGRYKLHDLWRDFARGRLRADEGAEGAARRAHAGAYAAYAGQHWKRDDVPTLAREFDDLKAAVEWAEASGEADILYRLVWETRYLMDASGRWAEGEKWLAVALKALGEDEGEQTRRRRANLLDALADRASSRGDYKESERLNRESLALDEKLGNKHGAAVTQGKLAELAMARGDYKEAERLQRKANAVYEELGDRRSVAVGQGILADLAARRGAWDEAEKLYHAALGTFEALGDRQQVAVSQAKLADVAARRGAWDEAEKLYRAALETFEALGDRREIAVQQAKLADVAIQQGDYKEAERLFTEAIATMQRLGDRQQAAAMQAGGLARLLIATGRREEGCALLAEAARTLREMGAADAEAAERLLRQHCGEGAAGQPDILEVIAGNTITVMTNVPDKREEWFGEVQRVLGQAKEHDDAPMAALLEAVSKLLTGDPVKEIKPELEGPHAAAWARIVEGISGGGEGPDIFEVVSHITVSVMTVEADRRDEWFEGVRGLLEQAKEADDAPMIALLEAVVRLLMGDSIEEIQPELEGAHAAAWARIVEGISGGDSS